MSAVNSVFNPNLLVFVDKLFGQTDNCDAISS